MDVLRHLLTAALLIVPAAAGAEEKTPMSRARFLDDCARIIAKAVKRKDTSHAVFHGCYDWHSAVHGHWALLRLDRTTRRHAAAARHAARALRGAALERERQLLRDRPAFEMPYGRAWFLRLAVELEQWAPTREDADARRLRPMAVEVARSLRTWLSGRRFDPTTPEYENHSWAAAQLHAWYAHRGDAKGKAWVRAWAGPSEAPIEDAPCFADDRERPEFFSRYGNWATLVLATQSSEAVAAFLAAHPVATDALAAIEPPTEAVHALGMNWSRAWALRRLATRDGARTVELEQAYAAHVARGIADHAVHAGRYLAYDHWVPQFAVYALTGES